MITHFTLIYIQIYPEAPTSIVNACSCANNSVSIKTTLSFLNLTVSYKQFNNTYNKMMKNTIASILLLSLVLVAVEGASIAADTEQKRKKTNKKSKKE